ncbi:type II CRISPR RNA-guided endonuclease Cas9 [Parvimonas parva]|uniref:CRISPR-associated endonuclease Cas9 n=1 Tax=Parvimonas parva TaxID=2769485 RepID=A0ABS1C8Q5_9FIRM|nr:type II CRISPR RNA-guided endonuclease Cas9 [Parvimonas parva]MBK1468333.1 type II CRISPR RNA-guided endonuclease Cas9 [Parvimonas parva]
MKGNIEKKKQEFNDYYLGFDIGTNSVGWAVSDLSYNLLRFNKKDMWGARLFDEAKTAKERRVKRNSRRRLERRSKRLKYLEEIFETEICKIDKNFFRRLEESTLHNEDKTFDFRFPIFNDENYTDKEYYKDFPTVYHLRNELIKNENKKFDIRLIYLAIHNILKYRGHFIFEGQDFDSVTDFKEVFSELSAYLSENLEENLDINLCDNIKDIICSKENKTSKGKSFVSLIDSKVIQSVLRCCIGYRVKFKDIFIDYEEKEKNEGINLSEIEYDEKRDEIALSLGENILLIDICKKVYDFMILNNILKGNKYISESKVNLYDEHKCDLCNLKYIFKKYLPKKDYFEFFRNENKEKNYVSYISSSLNNGKKKNTCTQEDLNKEIKEYIAKIKEYDENDAVLEKINLKLNENKLLPKLKTNDNGVIPYQIHKIELEKILQNQSKYYDFLLEKIDGITNIERIEKLFTFRIPYYIGTLKGKFSWAKLKENKKITPWNFEKIVDMEESAKAFIERMSNRCSYLKTENVLPKNSLLYSEYELLNELNKVKIKNEFINVVLKNEIIDELFKTTSKVTKKKFVDYLKTKQIFVEKEDISGLDNEFKSKLDSYIKFKKIIGDKIDTLRGYNFVEKCIEFKCFYGDDKKLFKNAINNTEFKDYVSDYELKKINKMKFNKWGRLSKRLLTEICFENVIESESFENIIVALRSTNYNFMEFTSKKFNLSEKVAEKNQENTLEKFNINEYVDELYVSPSVKRSIIQTYKIAMEIKKITGKNPKKIFIEMARGGGEKGKKTEKRKERIKTLYANMKDSNEEFLNNLDNLKLSVDNYDDNRLREKKLFLYFMQLGKSMYTGKNIDLNELLFANTYDIDHIIPQSKLKDDSFDNIVLVEKTINKDKDNRDYLDESIRLRMNKFWNFLREKGFITIEKYNRLRRNTYFSDDELSGFISRQLVTTRQSTLEVKKLFEFIFQNTDVVCSKANLVSDFREKYGIIKVRDLNDAHHAQDAYLNIVVGNVFDTKFTKNYWKFIEDRRKVDNTRETYNFKKIFDYDVSRGENVAWLKDYSINTISKMINKKTANITQMITEGKGQLFDLTILKKSKIDKKLTVIPNTPKLLKSSLKDSCKIAEKYGYFSTLMPAYFVVFKYIDKNKEVFGFDRIFIFDREKINSNEDIEKYLEDKGYNSPKFIRKVNLKQKILLNGYPYRIVGFTDNKLEIKNSKQFYSDGEHLKYIKHLSAFYNNNNNVKNGEYRINFLKKTSENDRNETTDEAKERLNIEFIKLYEYFCERLNSKIYANYYNSKKYDELIEVFDCFKNLNLLDKAKLLLEFLKIFKKDTYGNFKLLEKPELDKNGKQKLDKNGNLSFEGLSMAFGKLHGKKFKQLVEKDIQFVDESVTGLFEKKEGLEKWQDGEQ